MRPLELRDVSFSYTGSTQRALDHVSLDIEKGEFVTLLGANGSGKSTICLLCNGLIPHSLKGLLDGTVKVFGYDVLQHTVAEFATRVGLVFQEPESQLFCMSVEEEVAFGSENLAVPRAEIMERVEWALEAVGMKGYNERSPFSLSGGEKQRVAIAAALSMRPEMLVLDEPAYALDPVGRNSLYRLLRDLKERQGLTVLLAERDGEEASLFSDRVVLMKEGKIVEAGPPRELLRDTERLKSIGIVSPQLSEVAALLNRRLHRSDLIFQGIDQAERGILELLARGPGGSK